VTSVFAPPIAEPVLRGNNGSVYAVSSFGVDFTTFGAGFSPAEHFTSDRYRELDFKHQYPLCKRHDGKVYDFQGRLVRAGPYWGTQPFIGSSMPTTYVALDQRRPSNPYRLARLIVRSFTTLVFGEGRFPRIVSDDPDTQDFADALAKEANAAIKFTQARNIGGGVGTVGVSWRFWDGKPRIRVHNGKHLIPHTWIDHEEFVVEHVTELTQTSRLEYDVQKKKRVMKTFWVRRDWTPTADVQFVDAEVGDPNEPVEWIVDEKNTFFHDDGYPHFVWIRNCADDDDGTENDGTCDFEGQYESLDGLDVISSVTASGTVRNLDPTLVLAMSAAATEAAKNGTVRKGSGSALNVGQGGTAAYLEISGTATAAGLSLLKEQRAMLLESVQCVVPSTAELTSAGTSAVAQKMLFAPMLSATSIHRNEYGSGLVKVLEQMTKSARRRYPEIGDDGAPSYPVVVNDAGEEEEVEFFLALEPKIVSENVVDENGKPTGEQTTRSIELKPGKGRIRLEWPQYFQATSQDLQQKAGAVTSAAGGKPTLSQQTGVEIISAEVGTDPAREWQRVTAEARTAASAEAGMFGGIGGQVSSRDELPAGAEPIEAAGVGATGGKGAAAIAIAKLKMAAAVNDKVRTVNALRKDFGDPPLMKPDGSPDPNGELLLPAYIALVEAAGTAAGATGKGVPGLVPPPAGAPAAASPASPPPGGGDEPSDQE